MCFTFIYSYNIYILSACSDPKFLRSRYSYQTYFTKFVMRILVSQLVKKFLSFHEPRRFVVMFKRIFLFWARWIQFTSSQTISLISNLIISCHRHVWFQNYPFLSGFQTKILYIFVSFHACVIRSVRLIFLDLITLEIYLNVFTCWTVPSSERQAPCYFATSS